MAEDKAFFRQFYLDSLAHASYLIGSGDEAAVIDPQRDVDQYLEEAKNHGLTIRHIFETHIHADFVSGHLELSRRTGGKIYYGRKANLLFPFSPVGEGEELQVGDLRFRFFETPGHTPESLCIYVTGPSGLKSKLFTGDTLFIGDVGRPDLIVAKGLSSQEMAGTLYDSLRGSISRLPDETEVYPAHGAGSACGKNMSKERSSTLGEQRKLNWALKAMTRTEFVESLLSGLSPAPPYFAKDAEINRAGAQPLDELKPLRPLAPQEMVKEINQGSVVLDTRDREAYGKAHIPGSIHLSLTMQFEPWAGALLTAYPGFVLVANSPTDALEAQIRMARVGLERAIGYLEGGIEAWSAKKLEVASIRQISAEELKKRTNDLGSRLQILDVRRPTEFDGGHMSRAVNMPLDGFGLPEIKRIIESYDSARPTAVICASGSRSSVASSLLERFGFSSVYNVVGGMTAWNALNKNKND